VRAPRAELLGLKIQADRDEAVRRRQPGQELMRRGQWTLAHSLIRPAGCWSGA